MKRGDSRASWITSGAGDKGGLGVSLTIVQDRVPAIHGYAISRAESISQLYHQEVDDRLIHRLCEQRAKTIIQIDAA